MIEDQTMLDMEVGVSETEALCCWFCDKHKGGVEFFRVINSGHHDCSLLALRVQDIHLTG